MNEQFMREAIKLAINGVNQNKGGPFGTVIVKDDKIIARGWNQVTSSLDPTAHGEIVAIREACKQLGSFKLTGCEVYTSCEPCPMCLGALLWSRVSKIYYAANHSDAQKIGFDDSFFYTELKKALPERNIPMIELIREEALVAFELWDQKVDKIPY